MHLTHYNIIIPSFSSMFFTRLGTHTHTFLHWSRSLTVMFPVPGPTSNTTSVERRAAWRGGGGRSCNPFAVHVGKKRYRVYTSICITFMSCVCVCVCVLPVCVGWGERYLLNHAIDN